MVLSYTKLIRFDLLRDVESRLKAQGDFNAFLEFLKICQEIDKVDYFIKEMPSFPRSTKNIIRSELVSAIGSTLAIEGISLREDEIKEVLRESGLKGDIQRKEQEVLNSRNVYEYIKREVDNCKGDFVYTIEHICTIHKYFTENVEYIGNYPGKFRNIGATFGDPRKPSLCGSYNDIYKAVKFFTEWLNNKEGGPWSSNLFAKALMAHYYLTEIHPFGDGNGRVARAVEAMVLYVNKMDNYCFWSLANFWSANRNEYISHLSNVRKTCDPCDFIAWGTRGYLQEVKRIKTLVLKKVKRLMFRDYINWLAATNKDRPVKERFSKRIISVLMLLTYFDKISLDKFRSKHGYKILYSNLSQPTSNRDIAKMKSHKLICITTLNGKDFIELNYQIFNDLEYEV